MRDFFRWLVIVGSVAILGCKPQASSESSKNAPAPAAAPALQPVSHEPTLLRVHFIGMDALANDVTAAPWTSTILMPSSQALWAQTLGKLATAPQRWVHPRLPAATNDYAATFHALFSDLFAAESVLETIGDSNHVTETELAVRLPAGRAEFWSTNLLAIMEAWTGQRSEPTGTNGSGWKITQTDNGTIQVSQSGLWIVAGWSLTSTVLGKEYLSQITRAGGLPELRKGAWGEISIDPEGFPPVDSGIYSRFPKMDFQFGPSGENIRTEGEITFGQPIPRLAEDWQIPTNTIHDPIISFTACRGFQELLQLCLSEGQIHQQMLDLVPDEFFVWAGLDIPFQTLFAAPADDARQRLDRESARIIDGFSPFLAKNNAGRLMVDTERENRLHWTEIPPFVTPFLAVTRDGTQDFLLGGLLPNSDTTNIPPPELFQQVGRTNLVYYDWEITSARAGQWRAIVNVFRHIFDKPRLDPACASFVWVNSLTSRSNHLGNTITEITQSGSNRLAFLRQGTIGITGMELIALAHWLESPNFPFDSQKQGILPPMNVPTK